MTRTVWLGILLKRACRPAEGVAVSADSSGKGGGGTWVCSVGVSERLKEAGEVMRGICSEGMKGVSEGAGTVRGTRF